MNATNEALTTKINAELVGLRKQLNAAVGKEYAAGIRGQIMALHKVLGMIAD